MAKNEQNNYNYSDLAKNLELGKSSEYCAYYNPKLLQGVARSLNRDLLNINNNIPFSGIDLWTAYELSWLKPNGVPAVAIANIAVDVNSLNLIESKSFKLYLNSFNQTIFENLEKLTAVIQQDLTDCAKGEVMVEIIPVQDFKQQQISEFSAENIDDLDITINQYDFDEQLLANCSDLNQAVVEEKLCSNLLKSNCLITSQPDWGALYIHYVGHKIDRAKLLRYIVSMRNHNEFHEQCVERIYCDLIKYAKLEKLTVYARYTRRGGLDINPFRSNFERLDITQNKRNARQ